jgi:aldehyde dehydrogenase (NAD+)
MIEQLFLQQKHHSLSLRKENPRHRWDYLDALEKAVQKHVEELAEALYKDFRKPYFEVMLSEIYPLLKEIRFAKKNLKKWTKPQKKPTPWYLFGAKSFVQYEPLGCCLIISPWNYPVYLALSSLVGALAAGNSVIIKPSEFAPNTSRVIKAIVDQTFEKNHVAVILGGAETSADLLRLPFDHIFFTGSGAIGKKVLEAAAKNLSPVTLELGGKSPAIVDTSASIKYAAQRIAWGKFFNGGQTCVSPDYVLVHENIFSHFVEEMKSQIENFYGKTAQEIKQSDHFSRLVSQAHTIKLSQSLKETVAQGAEIVCGGDFDVDTRYVAPTLITNTNWNSPLMQEEIFGPILPIIKYKELSKAIHLINEQPKPLAVYMFSHDHLDIQRIKCETSSGGVVINNLLIHHSSPYLPFGGVGASGTGKYHGFYSFRTFSNEKAILHQKRVYPIHLLMQPPYDLTKMDLIKKLLRWG